MAIYLYVFFCELSVPTVTCPSPIFLVGCSSYSFKEPNSKILTFPSVINFVFFPLCHLSFDFCLLKYFVAFNFRNVVFLSRQTSWSLFFVVLVEISASPVLLWAI